MSGTISIDYAAVYSQVADLRSRLRRGASDAENSFNRAQAILVRMDGQVNAELQAALVQARRKAIVTNEVLERLLDTIYDSAMQMEIKEARLAAQFTAGMRSGFGLGESGGGLGILGVFSSANAAIGSSMANGINLSMNLGMAGLGNIMMGSVSGSASRMSGNGLTGLAGMNTGSAIGSVNMAFNGSFSGLNAMGTNGFAGSGAWAGSFNGTSLQENSGFLGIGLDSGMFNLDSFASTGAGAVGGVSGLGFGMSGIGMSSLGGASGSAFAPGGIGSFGGMGMMGVGAMGSLGTLRGGLQGGASVGRGTASVGNSINAAYTATSLSLQQFGLVPGGGTHANRTITTADWNWIRSTLSRPASSISDADFARLAELFVFITNVSDQERFLNYLADRVIITTPFVDNVHHDVAFTVCPIKVAGIQRHIDAGIAIMLYGQFQLMLSGFSYYSINTIDMERRRFMERTALLTVVGELAVLTQDVYNWPNNTVQRMLSTSEGRIGPFTLVRIGAANSQGLSFQEGISLTVQHGSITFVTSTNSRTGVQSVNARFLRDDSVGIVGSNTIHISNALTPTAANISIPNQIGLSLQIRHQFSATSHIASRVSSKMRSAAIATAWKATLPITGASIILPGLEIVSGMPSAQARAISIQRDIGSVVDASALGAYFQAFELESVIISEAGRSMQVLAWPTNNTYGRLLSLNSAINRTFTWAEFMQDPTAGFEVFRGLSSAEFRVFDDSQSQTYGAVPFKP